MRLPDLPEHFEHWFHQRGWQLRQHQKTMLAHAAEGKDALLIAPTGGGKTLSGLLPTLVDLFNNPDRQGSIHTIYISPLKALASDIARNLQAPVDELGLKVSIASRTGDTPHNRRLRLWSSPPDILITTPESLALLMSDQRSKALFSSLASLVLDELHALVETKRGVLLSLCIARLRQWCPQLRVTGLSATVANPPELMSYLNINTDQVALVTGDRGAEPVIDILLPNAYMPWSGHIALYAVKAVYEEILKARTSLVFVNTRAQSEFFFSALWKENEHNLPIALHHGSLSKEQRRKVENLVAKGKLRAIVCTSSLDLGIDWGDVELVIQVGAPKGVSRILQRIGRANHRLDQPSKAVLIPANRFEFLECLAAKQSIAEHSLDGEGVKKGSYDVLAQHIFATACHGPFMANDLYHEVSQSYCYQHLDRISFNRTLEFVANGGYALREYDRYRRLFQTHDGRYHLAEERFSRLYKMNIGTIVEQPLLKVRLKNGRYLGEIEEYFASMLEPHDTFLFAGLLLAFDKIVKNEMLVYRARSKEEPKVPAYGGGRLPMSSHLAQGVRSILANPQQWRHMPEPVVEWLQQQGERSRHAREDELLVETFERNNRYFVVSYGFAGRNAHQTLGMLLTKRLQRWGARPQGFVASDYCVATWSLAPCDRIEELFDPDLLGDDLEEWMAESSMIRRLFQQCAIIACLIERNQPGAEKSGRQLSFNADLIYKVLRKYEPDHILLEAAREEAGSQLIEIKRLSDMLNLVAGRIRHVKLSRISPFAVSIIASIGREFVFGDSVDSILDDFTKELVEEAMN